MIVSALCYAERLSMTCVDQAGLIPVRIRGVIFTGTRSCSYETNMEASSLALPAGDDFHCTDGPWNSFSARVSVDFSSAYRAR